MTSLLSSRRLPVGKLSCRKLLLILTTVCAIIYLYSGFSPLQRKEQQSQEREFKRLEQQERQAQQESYGLRGEQGQNQLQNEQPQELHQLQNEEQELHQLQNEKQQELQNEEQELHQLQNEKQQELHQLQNEKQQELRQLQNENQQELHQLQNEKQQDEEEKEDLEVPSSHSWPSWKDYSGKCSIDGYLWKEEDSKNFRVDHADRLVLKYLLDWTSPLPDNLTPLWSKAADWVSFTHLYPEHTPEMGTVAKALATAKVLNVTTSVSLDIGGINFKLFLTLDGGQYVLFKLKTADIYRIHDFSHSKTAPCFISDNHTPEIAAFHMSRILEFRKTPLAVGRKLHVEKEILPVATPELQQLIKIERDKTCVSKFCYEDGLMEGVMVLWLPERVQFRDHMHPWGAVCASILDHSYTHRLDK